ncbi:hypothetical protein R5W24_005888 [Gemmata sp. JC717]|uniref:hypothetical protein n=1 Tax=Gemmata algarum TaxID=2975278 RepID=UPI0021BB89C3|nr:hypothetical protein [Gemmata algarum]MDY3556718.1 hypothetical protein [Gemmata algarum]
MTRSVRILAFLLVTTFGAYGCMKAPSTPSTAAIQNTKLEKLEEEYRSAITTREQLRQKLLAAEQDAAAQKKALAEANSAAAAERDALKAEVKARTGERDALQGQYDTFRKTLRDMIGTADTAVIKLNLPAHTESAARSLSDRN